MIKSKVGVVLVAFLVFGLLSLSLISAALDVKKQAVSIMAIKELNKPAIFNLEITNNGPSDVFTIYNIVGIEMEPKESFSIGSGEKANIVVKAYPTLKPDYYSFEYKIKGDNTGMQRDDMAIIISTIKDAFNFYIDDISPESSKAIIHFDNKGGHSFENVKLKLSSAFFDSEKEFALSAYENKQIEIDIDRDKMRKILAGTYVANAEIIIEGKSDLTSTIIRFNELPQVKTQESVEGWFSRRYELEKRNDGNTKVAVSAIITKNWITGLFTTISPAPSKKEIRGFRINYMFEKELSPNESLRIVAKTNWWILVLVVVGICIVFYVINKYIREKLVLNKSVSFVRTKGGEFALKVSLKVKARDFVEKIRIIDRLPAMVKLFDSFGLTKPDRIDEKLRRLEWNISGMAAGEERIFNYIIYSKIGVVGKFELPQAGAIYEYLGKMKEANSNVAFFLNEPKAKEE